MSSHYNLRSREKPKHVRHLDKNNALSYSLVKIERLKIIENPANLNCTFYVKENKVTLKKTSFAKLPKVKYFIIFFVVFFIIASYIFFRDETVDMLVKTKLFHSYQVASKKFRGWFSFKILKNKSEIDDTQTKIYSKVCVGHFQDDKKFISDLKVQKMIQTEIINFFNETNFSEKTCPSFIQQECQREIYSDFFNNFSSSNAGATSDNLIDSPVFTDYALKSRGAQVLSVYDTEPYGDVTLKYFNLIWNNFFVHTLFSANGPSSVLVPWTKAGDCWAFKGTKGQILIKLSDKIVVTAVSIDHISRNFVEDRSTDSAPKKFSVIGIEKQDVLERNTHLGTFYYKISGPNLQTFYVNSQSKIHFNLIKFNFYSNHGNENYTCIYKIRVHGYS